ncbi:hypothetical protein [Methanothrix sp.]|uniref:hypothetical protein n=1 Tax=Methanothrix sp. TaxID=90426 RepID=UPI003299DFEA
MIEIDEISNENVLLDVSESAKEHISGSIAIPYQEFLQGDSLKSCLAEEGHRLQPMSTGCLNPWGMKMSGS